MKGTMSEAELHVLHARLRGGMVNKARRGDLAVRLPVGLVYSPMGKVVLNPDRQVQQSLRLLFETFARVGSAHGTVRFFCEQGLEFPKRLHWGSSKGEIVWRALSDSRVVVVVHNPRYAVAYSYGRRTQRRSGIDGRGWPTCAPTSPTGASRWCVTTDTIATSHGVNGRWKETMTPFPPSSSRRGMKKSSGETGLNKNRLNILNIYNLCGGC
jgi:hypothetical protein